MNRSASIVAVLVVFGAACGIPTGGEDHPLEQSRPAIQMAADYEDLDPPADFGFVPTALPTDLPQSSGFARWYCPKSVITRAQMAAFVARTVHGADDPLPDYSGGFSDVSSHNPFATSIEFVSRRGISDGCADGAFCPDDGVTRGQMALYVTRMMHGADYILPAPTGLYGDVPVDHMHAAAIEQLALDGIEVGCDASNFCPDRPISRDEVASFLVPAKYRNGAPGVAPDVFADVAVQNPNLAAVNVFARDRVTFGCEAPQAGYRVHGEPLTELQRDWILYFAARTLPRLTRAYGDSARAFTVGARVIWWSLKEGVFGVMADPFRHSLCNGEYISPFDTCSGEWEVGLTATRVPGDAEVMAAASLLYPERNVNEVALNLVEFGRALSANSEALEYPVYASDRVASDATLRRSWLARDATIGAWLIIDDIERNCIDGSSEGCYGTGWEATRDFAPDAQTASEVQADLRRILADLRPR